MTWWGSAESARAGRSTHGGVLRNWVALSQQKPLRTLGSADQDGETKDETRGVATVVSYTLLFGNMEKRRGKWALIASSSSKETLVKGRLV